MMDNEVSETMVEYEIDIDSVRVLEGEDPDIQKIVIDFMIEEDVSELSSINVTDGDIVEVDCDCGGFYILLEGTGQGYEMAKQKIENDDLYRDQWKIAIATDDTVLGFDDWVLWTIDSNGWESIVCPYEDGYGYLYSIYEDRRVCNETIIYYRVN